MNKKNLIKKYSEKNNISLKESTERFENIFNLIVESLQENSEFSIPGFGKIVIKSSVSREARNPKTGEKINVPAKKSIKFKPAKQLVESFNN